MLLSSQKLESGGAWEWKLVFFTQQFPTIGAGDMEFWYGDNQIKQPEVIDRSGEWRESLGSKLRVKGMVSRPSRSCLIFSLSVAIAVADGWMVTIACRGFSGV